MRSDGDLPRFVATDDIVDAVVAASVTEAVEGAAGNVAVVAPKSLYERVVDAFDRAGVPVGRAPRDGLSHQITVVPVHLVKGLEVDVAVVVEPARILAEEPQPARSLYVACTRATRHLVVVHGEPLPDMIAPAGQGYDTRDQPTSGSSAA